MKKLFILFLFFLSLTSRAQLISFYVTGVDTLWGRNPTTGATIRLNRYGALLNKDTADMLANYVNKNIATIKQYVYSATIAQQLYTTPAVITGFTFLQVFRNGISVDFSIPSATQIQITPAVDVGDKIKILQQF